MIGALERDQSLVHCLCARCLNPFSDDDCIGGNETSSFHFPTSKVTITLDDLWHILRLSIHGDRVIYDADVGSNAYFDVMEVKELALSKGQIDLDYYRCQVSIFRLIVTTIILGLVAPDQQGRHFILGWGLS